MTDQPPAPGDPTTPGPTTPGPTTPGPTTPGDPTFPGTPDPYAAYGTTETIEGPPRRSRRGLVIGATAAVLAVLAGAVVWATTTLSGGGRQPDELVPKTTFAYVKVDLDPAANQKLAARSFFGKFPGLKDEAAETENVFENILASVVTGPDVDYRTDVQPWFDRRAAAAVFPAAGGEPHIVAVLRSKDDSAARAKMDELVREAKADGEDLAYRIADGYVVLGEASDVDAARTLTEQESLEDNELYRADVERLDGDQVAVGWVDVAAGFDQLKGEVPDLGLLPNAFTDAIKGRVVMGLHFTNDFVEVQGLTVGFDTRQVPPANEAATLLTGLPADTAAAVAVNGLRTSFGQAGGVVELYALLEQYLYGSGLSFTNDILPLIGDETVVVAARSTFAAPRIGYVSTVPDGAAAQRAGAKLAQLLSVLGVEAVAGGEGDRFVLATPPDYTKQLTTGTGTLGSAPTFTKAMGDLKGSVLAIYLDTEQAAGLVPFFFGGTARSGVAAGGLVVGVSGDAAFFRLRVVA